jgi:hypothetical protein
MSKAAKFLESFDDDLSRADRQRFNMAEKSLASSCAGVKLNGLMKHDEATRMIKELTGRDVVREGACGCGPKNEAKRDDHLDAVWNNTHRDYKGMDAKGNRSIMVLRNGATKIVNLSDLTDDEVKDRVSSKPKYKVSKNESASDMLKAAMAVEEDSVDEDIEHKGWTIKPFYGVQIGHRLPDSHNLSAQLGFGTHRKVKGYTVSHPEHMPDGHGGTLHSTVKRAKEYINNYMGESVLKEGSDCEDEDADGSHMKAGMDHLAKAKEIEAKRKAKPKTKASWESTAKEQGKDNNKLKDAQDPKDDKDLGGEKDEDVVAEATWYDDQGRPKNPAHNDLYSHVHDHFHGSKKLNPGDKVQDSYGADWEVTDTGPKHVGFKSNAGTKLRLGDQGKHEAMDPTKQEMMDYLKSHLSGLVDWRDGGDDDAEIAIKYFGDHFHSGQWSNLYSAASTSPYSPNYATFDDDYESGSVGIMYDALWDKFAPDIKRDEAQELSDADIEQFLIPEEQVGE